MRNLLCPWPERGKQGDAVVGTPSTFVRVVVVHAPLGYAELYELKALVLCEPSDSFKVWRLNFDNNTLWALGHLVRLLNHEAPALYPLPTKHRLGSSESAHNCPACDAFYYLAVNL